MKRFFVLVPALAGLLNAVELMPMVVNGENTPQATQGEEPLEEKLTLGREGIKLFGPAAQSNPLQALDMTPGLIVETQDAYGMGEVSARERGVDDNFMALTIDGVPNYAIRPIGPRMGIYDLENLESIEQYRGALNPKSGPGVGSKGGLFNLRWLRPSDTPGAVFSLRGGSDAFSKLYGRLESGKTGNVKAFVAASRSEAEKWKGEGDLGPRTNVAAGLVYDNDIFPMELFYNHTEHKRHDFMGLSYQQIKNLGSNYDLDYQDDDPTAADYYDYRKRSSRYDDLQLGLRPACGGAECAVKLYGSGFLENSDEGNGKGTVDAQRIGVTLSGTFQGEAWDAEAGIWAERSWLVKYVEKVAADPSRAHQGWKWLNKNDGPTELVSPYLRGESGFGKVRAEAGIRYLEYKEAGNDTYLPNNTESDYDKAIKNGTIAPGGSVGAQSYRLWLPTLGLRYNADDATELFAKWGRGYQRPYRYSFAAQYAANQAGLRDKLQALGLGLEDIVKQWEMETSDLFDVGVRRYFDSGELTATLFYHRHHDLLSTAYDPALDVDYLQNVGEASVYGVQLQSSIEAADGFWFFANPAYMQSRIEEDLTLSGTRNKLKGNQIAETPAFTMKLGGAYRANGYLLSLTARHIGERYADIENDEKVDAYTTADLRCGYGFKAGFMEEAELFFSVLNLTDEQYVSAIGSADLLDDTPSYYVGAPRSFVIGLEGRL